MTHLEKGCYIDLLMLQFNRGKFTLAHAKHMLGSSFDLAWANIAEKFETDGEFFWNERLNEEKEKRAKFTESRRTNGLRKKSEKKNKEHMQKHTNKHMLMHMENENVNENKDDIDNNSLSITPREKKMKPPKNDWPDEQKKQYMEKHFPTLLRMTKPLTQSEIEVLIEKYGKDAVLKKMEALENKKDAQKKYKSAYSTLNTWLRDFPDTGIKADKTGLKTTKEEKIQKAMEILNSGDPLIAEI